MRIQSELPVDPGQTYVIDDFRPEDAAGVASLFLSIYGDSYPLETYYDPQRIAAENASGAIHSVVARTPKGDIVGHGALFRSSPPNARLYEVGQYIILKPYRMTRIAYLLNKCLCTEVAPRSGICGFFGEAVCNHVTTQKCSRAAGGSEGALEIDLMPEGAYEAEGAVGRVSCLVLFRILEDRPARICLPAIYRPQLETLIAGFQVSRAYASETQDLPKDVPSSIEGRVFSDAGVGRYHVFQVGADFEIAAGRLDAEADKQGVSVRQFFLNLGDPRTMVAVEVLRSRGYFFGGYLPRWFDADGMVMQKMTHDPGFERIKLFSDKARWLLEEIRRDWRRTIS